MLQNQCTEFQQLTISNSIFHELTLKEKWLKAIEPDIRSLRLEDNTLKEIKEKAFAGHPFLNLNKLVIINSNLKKLKRESFLEMNSLIDFAFLNFANTYVLQLEENVLEGMSGSLSILEISKFTFSLSTLSQLFGSRGALAPSLVTLVLSYNSIPGIDKYAFEKAPSLRALYLLESGIKNIHREAFWGNQLLEMINLKNNLLQSLEDGTFDKSQKLKQQRVYLSQNYWNCNCTLEWLKLCYINSNVIDEKEPPLCWLKSSFEEVEFCNDNTPITSTTLDKSTITTESTPGNNPNRSYIHVKCRELIDFTYHSDTIYSINTVEVIIEEEVVNLDFQELDDELLTIRILINEYLENLSDYRLIWFNSNNKSENGCVATIENNMLLYELKRNITYAFGVLHKDTNKISPKCCFGLKTNPEWSERTWILNKYKVLILSITICGVIILLGLAIFLTVLCIWKHPNLIENNKNIVVIKSKNSNSESNVPAMDYERPVYWEPYIVPSSHGYLTPKYQRCDRARYRSPLIRSYSDCSISNNQNRYSYDYKEDERIRKNNWSYESASTSNDYRPALPPPNLKSRQLLRDQTHFNKISHIL